MSRLSDAATLLAARRRTPRGGRAPSCECGSCPLCTNRERVRRYRAAHANKRRKRKLTA